MLTELLRELRALEAAEAVITARPDLIETFVWQCVLAALRDRRATLLERASREASVMSSLSLTSTTSDGADDDTRTSSSGVPPVRVH